MSIASPRRFPFTPRRDGPRHGCQIPRRCRALEAAGPRARWLLTVAAAGPVRPFVAIIASATCALARSGSSATAAANARSRRRPNGEQSVETPSAWRRRRPSPLRDGRGAPRARAGRSRVSPASSDGRGLAAISGLPWSPFLAPPDRPDAEDARHRGAGWPMIGRPSASIERRCRTGAARMRHRRPAGLPTAGALQDRRSVPEATTTRSPAPAHRAVAGGHTSSSRRRAGSETSATPPASTVSCPPATRPRRWRRPLSAAAAMAQNLPLPQAFAGIGAGPPSRATASRVRGRIASITCRQSRPASRARANPRCATQLLQRLRAECVQVRQFRGAPVSRKLMRGVHRGATQQGDRRATSGRSAPRRPRSARADHSGRSRTAAPSAPAPRRPTDPAPPGRRSPRPAPPARTRSQGLRHAALGGVPGRGAPRRRPTATGRRRKLHSASMRARHQADDPAGL